MERLHKVDDQLDVYYRSMANSYQCMEAELSALLRDIEEQAASKSPDVARKRIPSNSSDSEQQRKQGLLKMKTEAMKR
ncbi:hypothetical protein IscW_ISCW021284 [Ixodes scapularis]|uniref:Uncharacterized protein n=1 Tax=Ixodes scapularis TaxID=6945 RepID=B7Q5K6_IXOSC|nr:hypothetical protein IscW_ISCW021284 [Ixodes scapularis]|eukprot:XP_002402011.1 hypothetical protein IscW_ISCW021284 [Ixodes scapularis]